MRAFDFDHLADGDVLPALSTWNARERSSSVMVIALIAVADARKLYLPAGYPSMAAYCVGELGLSEDAAFKRIDVARKARQYPAIFAALEEGRLHMTAVLVLAPYLTPEWADELLAAATHKSKAEIEQMLAERYPRSERLPMVQALPATSDQLAPERVAAFADQPGGEATPELAPERVAPPARRAKAAPIAADRFEWQLTVGRSAQEKLQHARNLLSHQIPSGDMAEVLERGLDALIAKLEKAKYGATDRPRTSPRRATGKRTIPAQVQRAVWKRDQGRCTFVGDTGHRCGARKFIEFDHIDPVARGGPATLENLRLRCRAHNQFEAERVFGSGFMDRKRRARVQEAVAEVIPWLRALGIRADESQRAAALAESIPNAPLQERVRLALTCLRPRAYSYTPAPAPLDVVTPS